MKNSFYDQASCKQQVWSGGYEMGFFLFGFLEEMLYKQIYIVHFRLVFTSRINENIESEH